MENQKTGFILINKEEGPSSHRIVDQMRKITGIKKIGHAGTLDPFANGLLILAIGRESTKKISQFVKKDKEYIAKLILGKNTNTYDKEGEIKQISNKIPSISEIKNTLSLFIGEQTQIPPMFSAKKVSGQKLYELARKGIEIERAPSNINVYTLEMISYNYPELEIKTRVSSGTYIRSLAFDIGEKLRTGAYLDTLSRTKIEKYDLKNSKKIKDLSPDNWEKYLFR